MALNSLFCANVPLRNYSHLQLTATRAWPVIQHP